MTVREALEFIKVDPEVLLNTEIGGPAVRHGNAHVAVSARVYIDVDEGGVAELKIHNWEARPS